MSFVSTFQSDPSDKQEEISFTNIKALRKALHQLHSYNRAAQRHYDAMHAEDEFERNRASAEIDNDTPGFGLRRGPLRSSWSDRYRTERTNGVVDAPASQSTASLLSTPMAKTRSEALREATETWMLAQQALLIASRGGIAAAQSQAPDDAPIPQEVGRGLFFALSSTLWEEDEETVLEVGWAALWFRQGAEGGGGYEEMRDQGHYMSASAQIGADQ